MTLTPARLVLFVLFLVATSPAATAQAFDDDPHNHIRTTDRRLLRLLRDGLRSSDTFRGLVKRLRRSDVVVFLECGGGGRATGGRLAFISAVGGYRYVHVRVARLAAADVQIALIAHELRHAVEIADAPSVVDDSSLAREYERIGYLSRRLAPGVSFDSTAAVEAGYEVLRDLSDKEPGLRPAASLQLSNAY
jgi:hypothetical protein